MANSSSGDDFWPKRHIHDFDPSLQHGVADAPRWLGMQALRGSLQFNNPRKFEQGMLYVSDIQRNN